MRGKEGVVDLSNGIHFNNVSFSYPGSKYAALDNISVSISSGETIAIVGKNGAGKSTLVRLLAGLFEPDCGIVNIGGKDSKLTSHKSIQHCISAVFQNFQKYKMTLSENVTISRVIDNQNESKILRVLNESEFVHESLALDSMLSPEFGGIDLSIGQWQRIAIARGLFRENALIILDEPTSAIDPLEEIHIYKQFSEVIKNKCAVIVTHRLASTKLADKIIVMDNGAIVDVGTHNELLNRRGLYFEMWEAQASWYKES